MIQQGIDFFTEYPWAFFPAFYAFICLRLILFSGGMYLLLWKLFPNQLERRRIQHGQPYKGQIREEIIASCLGYFTWAAIAQALWFVFAAGWTKIYVDLDSRPLYWIPLGIVLAMLIHDFYFYWLHRWLHTPWAFKNVHYTHHRSKVPTPYAAHSFHWIESLLNGLYIIPIILLVPMHVGTLFAFAMLTHFFSTWGHFNYELMPFQTWFKWWGRWVTTSSHHNHHHIFVTKNFGLYVRYWDKWFGTLSPKTQEYFEKKIVS